MKRRDQIQLVVLAISAVAYFPFSECISTTRFGTSIFLEGQLLYAMLFLVAVLATPVLIICMYFPGTRRRLFFSLLLSALFIPSVIGGVILGSKTRTAGMRSFAQRSQPLIAAIKQYQRDHSAAPESLNDLVPRYLPTVPSTGMMAYPEYCYHTGKEVKERFAGNPWALSVVTPSGGINFDEMVYYPDQNYGEHGALERIGDWAYVHE